MRKFKLIGAASHPEDLHDGRVLGPNDEVTLTKEEQSHPHNKRLIDDGLLVTVDEKQPEILEGKPLRDAGKRLGIEGYSDMDADELRAKVAEATAEKEGGSS